MARSENLPGSAKLPRNALAYLSARAVSPAAAEGAKLRYLTAAERRELVGAQPRAPGGEDDSDGLYIPLNGYPGEYTIRALHPEVKQPKFKMPHKAPQRPYWSPGANWKEIQGSAGRGVSICEGPIKALAMTSHGFPTIGINGTHGWSSRRGPIEVFTEDGEMLWAEREVFLTPDSDVHKNTSVQDGWMRLALILAALGARVSFRLIYPSEEYPKLGPDDFLKLFRLKDFRELECLPHDDPRFSSWGTPAEVAELNLTHAFITSGRREIYVDESSGGEKKYGVISVQEFYQTHRNARAVQVGVNPNTGNPKFKKLPDYWMDSPHRRNIRGITFDPSRAWGVDSSTQLANIWPGMGVEPHAPDSTHSWSLLKAHIREIVCGGNREHFEYVMGWMAFGVQRMNSRPGVALVLKGGQGTGKGIFANNYIQLFGEGGIQVDQPKHLIGSFNGHLANKLAVFADEAFFAGDHSVIGTLNRMITEPTRTVEAKFRDALTVPNYLRLIIASNEDRVVQAADDARRFAIFRLREDVKQNSVHFSAMQRQMDSGGREAMLHELLAHDISQFNVRAFPRTDEMTRQKFFTDDPFKGWWHEVLRDGWVGPSLTPMSERVWRAFVSMEELRSSFLERAGRDKFTQQQMGPRMAAMFHEYGGRDGLIVDTRRNNSAGHRVRGYLFPPTVEECQRAVERAMGIGALNWENFMGMLPQNVVLIKSRGTPKRL